MHKYICVKPSGQIAYTFQLSNDDDLPGDLPDGMVSIKVPFETNESELFLCYFDFDSNEIIKLPPRPSEFYDFDGTTRQWAFNAQRASDAAIQKRSALLNASDWTQLPDATLSNKAEWAAYRQALRDVPQQDGYPQTIVWPVEPK